MGVRSLNGQELRDLPQSLQVRDASARGVMGIRPADGTPRVHSRVEGNEPETQGTSPPAIEERASSRAGTRLRIDDNTRRIVAQILNGDNQVIKQIPPEDLLRIIARIAEIEGLLFDHNA
ncbi:MAG: flagellar protein FlaG [Candidatus Hydrogenedentes bacterium]|nr:flagellar protein FlaG [Candidatus Hydrogenedentota bacterium]